jgi:hypothetical protein
MRCNGGLIEYAFISIERSDMCPCPLVTQPTTILGLNYQGQHVVIRYFHGTQYHPISNTIPKVGGEGLNQHSIR